jgi:hypothetical protein
MPRTIVRLSFTACIHLLSKRIVANNLTSAHSIVLQLLRKTIAAIIYNFDISFWDENHMDRGSFNYMDAYPRSDKLDCLHIKVVPRSASERDGTLFE